MGRAFWLVIAGCGAVGESPPTDDVGGTTGAATGPDAELPPPPPEPGDCDASAPVTLFVSPDDSNSMTSPVFARATVLHYGVVKGAIREWEFFNYFAFEQTEPAPGELDVALALGEGAEPGTWTLQVGVATERVAPDARKPMSLTFAIDTSGSMLGEPMAVTTRILETVASQLVAGDTVSLVTWDEAPVIALEGHPVAGPDDAVVLAAVSSLVAGGQTRLTAGLDAGYRLAERHRRADAINRVVLITDGGANLGETDATLIAEYAEEQETSGIYLVGVGVGSPSVYDDVLLDAVTDAGKGASVYIPDAAEADRVFGARLLETLDVAARDVRVALELPPGFQVKHTSAEAVSTEPEAVEPQHLAPNDVSVLHQQLVTCAPERVGDDTPLAVVVTWQDPSTLADREVRVETTFGELLAVDAPNLRKGDAVAAYVAALRAMRDRTDDAPAVVDAAFAALERAEADGFDADLSEVRQVLEGVSGW